MGLDGKDARDQAADSNQPLLARIEETHRHIVNFYLKELAAAQDLGRIRELVDPLPELLSKHFADEEGPDGLFDSLRARRPALDSGLKSLQREHRKVLKAVEALRQQVQEADLLEREDDRRERLSDIRKETSAFMRIVRRHERTETRLVSDTYYTEEGGSG
jgi:hypothetical protein